MSKPKKKYLILEEGDIICPKCNGSTLSTRSRHFCWRCRGVGKLDWIMQMMPPETPRTLYGHFVPTAGFRIWGQKTLRLKKKDLKRHLRYVHKIRLRYKQQ